MSLVWLLTHHTRFSSVVCRITCKKSRLVLVSLQFWLFNHFVTKVIENQCEPIFGPLSEIICVFKGLRFLTHCAHHYWPNLPTLCSSDSICLRAVLGTRNFDVFRAAQSFQSGQGYSHQLVKGVSTYAQSRRISALRFSSMDFIHIACVSPEWIVNFEFTADKNPDYTSLQ